uniref:Uncharacterized protein n=1 Tax=Arundo donax TaxID=35708 RepID=A0A0A8ZET2_ARUDO
MNNAECADAKAGFIDKVSHFRKNLEGLKTRLQQINERCNKRYKYAGCIPSTTSVVVDPGMSASYKEAARLVGLDGPKGELINQVKMIRGNK